MKRSAWSWAPVALLGIALVGFGAPSWLALAAGLVVALASGKSPPPAVRALTSRTLQLGVVALGAGMNLEVVWRIGSSGALITAISLTAALALGLALGRWLRVRGDTPLLISVGTAICGGSAIAAVASVIKPKEHEISVALAVVFVLNAVGLVLFPLLGHAFGLSQPVFGRWAALAIHDTSSVVGAGMAYGPVALGIATTTKLARALWIVPVAFAIAIGRQRGAGASLRDVRWPWFILAFVMVAALFTWIPGLAPLSHPIVLVGQRALVLALFLIGLSLSRSALASVGVRPLLLGIGLWVVVAAVSLPLAMAAAG
ncbi:MAG TPA: putative sulfate exporter family transporter [Kofleriaceae bacterium]|nr:putative sulfate exporter family transporter [Kofleriaceae bacterium]